jgi:branched-chain amino acid transport system permease protein
VPLSEATRIYFGGTGGTVDLMIYGALIVLICIFRPEGLLGIGRELLRRAPGPPATREA